MAHVKVNQLNSINGSAYVNVKEKDGYIELYGDCWSQPVYLGRMNGTIGFWLLIFDSQADADDYIDNKANFNQIVRIYPAE